MKVIEAPFQLKKHILGLLQEMPLSYNDLCNKLNAPPHEIQTTLAYLTTIGLLEQYNNNYNLTKKIELLNSQSITKYLSDTTQQSLHTLYMLDEVDSTNAYLALKLASVPTACIAELQTQGRGQRNRNWHMDYGQNIMLSLAWPMNIPVVKCLGLSQMVAMVICETLNDLTNDNRYRIKWPNDILYQNKKLAGILIELKPYQYKHYAIIGIGLNFAMSASTKQLIDQPTIDLQTIQANQTNPVTRNQLFAALLNSLCTAIPKFIDHGLELWLAKWPALDTYFERVINIKRNQQEYSGTVLGINERGELLLKTKSETLAFHSGDIRLPKPI